MKKRVLVTLVLHFGVALLLTGCVGGSRGTGVRSLTREEDPASRILRGIDRAAEDRYDERDDEHCDGENDCKNGGRRWR